MSDHNENSFQAAIKALSQVVAPSVDPSNPLAVDQLRLVIQFLEFYVERQPLQGKLDWRELELNVEFGMAVLRQSRSAASADIQALEDNVEKGRSYLAHPGPAISERQRLSDNIAAAISDMVSQSTHAGDQSENRVELVVLEYSKKHLDLKRSWYLPFGFEADPKSISPIEAALAGCPDV